ncbi:hypothetical protein CSUI_009578, partial [Cystoisospora suis]
VLASLCGSCPSLTALDGQGLEPSLTRHARSRAEVRLQCDGERVRWEKVKRTRSPLHAVSQSLRQETPGLPSRGCSQMPASQCLQVRLSLATYTPTRIPSVSQTANHGVRTQVAGNWPPATSVQAFHDEK